MVLVCQACCGEVCIKWTSLFGGDQCLTGALLDRLAFHAHMLHVTRQIFRLCHSLGQQGTSAAHAGVARTGGNDVGYLFG